MGHVPCILHFWNEVEVCVVEAFEYLTPSEKALDCSIAMKPSSPGAPPGLMEKVSLLISLPKIGWVSHLFMLLVTLVCSLMKQSSRFNS